MRFSLTYHNKKYIIIVTVRVKLKIVPQNQLYWEGFRSFFALNCVYYLCEKVFKNRRFFNWWRFFFFDLLYSIHRYAAQMQHIQNYPGLKQPTVGTKSLEHAKSLERSGKNTHKRPKKDFSLNFHLISKKYSSSSSYLLP